MIDPEIQRILDRKQDTVMLGHPVPQEGAVGDMRVNVTNKGKFYQMMKAGENEWRYSAPFTRTPIDYLPLTGGRITGSLGLPNVKTGVDDTVLIRDTDGNVKTDEIDGKVWALKLVDYSGTPTAGHIPYFTDQDTITMDENQLFWDASNNRLGIGTTAPGTTLEVQSSSAILRLRDTGATANATTAYVEFGGTDAGVWSRTGYVGDGSSGNTDIYLQAESSDLHLGDSSGFSVLNLQGGNVGIGLTSVDANYKLIVRRAADVNFGIGLQGSELALTAFNDAISANVPMRFYASEYNFINGKVGIGTTVPADLL